LTLHPRVRILLSEPALQRRDLTVDDG